MGPQPQMQKKERLPSTSSAAEVNQIVTRSSKSSIAGHDLDNVSPAFLEKLVKTVETCLLARINDIVRESEARIMAKFDESIGALKETIKRHELSIEKLQERNDSLCSKINDLHRIQRLSDIVVRGIPQQPNENPVQVIRDMAAAIDHPISTYVDAFRVRAKSSGPAPPIIARFSCHSEQKAFLAAYRKRKGIKLSQLGDFSSASPVYVSESLTPSNNSLLREAIKLRKLGKISSARTRNGLVYVRMVNDDRELRIHNLEQLLNQLSD